MDTGTRPGRAARARRRLGQHFLTRPGPVRRVVEAIAPEQRQRFLEVGPGRGALTCPLLAAGARLLAIEIDPVLVRNLPERASGTGNLVVVQGDILTVDLPPLLNRHLPPGRGIRVVGNLPYSVASPTLLRLLALGERFSDLTLMVQREVADRILSGPGSRDYGVLTLLCACRARAARLLTLSPSNFSPPPEVHSTLLRFLPHRPPFESPDAFEAFERVIKAAFSGRRKILRNSLSAGLARNPREVEAWLQAAGVDPGARPEQVPLEGYLRLTRSARPAGPPFLL